VSGWFASEKSVLRENSEKRPFGGHLSILPFLGFLATESRSGGRTRTAHCREARALQAMSTGIGNIVWGTDDGRNSLLERDFVAVCPSRIAGFDQVPTIRVAAAR